MDASSWVNRVDKRTAALIAEFSQSLSQLGPEVQAFTDYAGDLLRGGKRFRATFCALGYSSVNHVLPDALVDVAAGLEMFHAAALIHDDIMDKSDTRRGRPAAHRYFESEHTRLGWANDAEAYGQSSALLLGDFLLAMSDAVIARGFASNTVPQFALAARQEFDCMRFDVTAGQYLDIVEENAWPQVQTEDALPRARTVLTYKSAKYSIEAPLVIGAALAGASPSLLSGLREFALPLGNAFQLRDDMLGVFGDAETTGKPVGDDIREGKRTVLIARAMQSLNDADCDKLNRVLGNPGASAEDISWAQQVIETSGARAAVEVEISSEYRVAINALNDLGLDDTATSDLTHLAQRVVNRSA